MNFRTCIDAAIIAGKIKETKGEEAKRAYDDALEEAQLEGLAPDAAENRAATVAVERLGKMTAAKKWQKVNEIRKTARLWERFAGTDRPDLELQKLADEWDIAASRVAGQATRLFVQNIEASRPKLAGLVTPTRHHDAIVHAAYGRTADKTATQLHHEIVNVDEFLRKRANMEGTSIHENPNRRMAQMQDRHKLVNHAKAHPRGAIGARAEWIQEHLDGLDWDMMRYDGIEIPVGRREEILGRSYDSIYTKGNSRVTPGHVGAESLANRMGRERFFYYKDADTWLKMQKKYGAGSVFHQEVSSIEIMARDIAMLETMGPNPVAMLNYANNLANAQAAKVDLANPRPKGKTMVDKVAKAQDSFKNRFDLHNHAVNNGDASVMAQTLGTARTLTLAGILDGAFIANLGDMSMGLHAKLLHKLPMTGYLRGVIKTFMLMSSKKRRIEAMRAGLNFDAALRMALAGQRYLGPLDGAYRAQWISDVIYRMTWLTPYTQASLWNAGRHVMGIFADSAKTRYNDLSFVNDLRLYGITEVDWDLFRQTPIVTEHGVPYLRPVDVLNRVDLEPEARQRLSDKFWDFMATFQRDAVPQADTLSQETIGLATPANRFSGQMTRTWGMLKSFPTVIFQRHLMEAARRAPTPRLRIVYIARYVAMLTMAGAMITQLKEMANGRDPLDMTKPSFWVRALLNGGSVGFAGDALFNGLGRYRHGGLAEAFGGPFLEFAGKLRDLGYEGGESLYDFVTGQERDTQFAKQLTEFGFRYAPIPWQLKLALERAVYEEILRQADPKTLGRLQRREQDRWENYRQKSWWRPGDTTPHRLPNLGAIFGGSRED